MVPLAPAELAAVIEGRSDLAVRAVLGVFAVQAAPADAFVAIDGHDEVVAFLHPREPAAAGIARLDELALAAAAPDAGTLVGHRHDVTEAATPDHPDLVDGLGLDSEVLEIDGELGRGALGGSRGNTFTVALEETLLRIEEVVLAVTLERDIAILQAGEEDELAVGHLTERLAFDLGAGAAQGQRGRSDGRRERILALLGEAVLEVALVIGVDDGGHIAVVEDGTHLPEVVPLAPSELADVVEGLGDLAVGTALGVFAVETAPAHLFAIDSRDEVVAFLGPAQPSRRIGLRTGSIHEDDAAFAGELAAALVAQGDDGLVVAAPDHADVGVDLVEGDLVGGEVHRHAGHALGGGHVIGALADVQVAVVLDEVLDPFSVHEGQGAGVQFRIGDELVAVLAEGLAVGLGGGAGKEQFGRSGRRLVVLDRTGFLHHVGELVVLVGPDGHADILEVEGVVHLPEGVPVGLVELIDIVERFGAIRREGVAAEAGAPALLDTVDLHEEGIAFLHPGAPARSSVTAGAVEHGLALAGEHAVPLVLEDGEIDTGRLPGCVQLGLDGLDLQAQGVEVHRDAGQAGRRGFLHRVVALALDELAGRAGVEHQAAALLGGKPEGTGTQAGDDGIQALFHHAELLACFLGGGAGHEQALGHVVDALAAGDVQGLVAVVHLGYTALGTADRPDEGTGLVREDTRLAGDGVQGGVAQSQGLAGAEVARHYGQRFGEVAAGPVEEDFVQDDTTVRRAAAGPGKLDRGGGGDVQHHRGRRGQGGRHREVRIQLIVLLAGRRNGQQG